MDIVETLRTLVKGADDATFLSIAVMLEEEASKRMGKHVKLIAKGDLSQFMTAGPYAEVEIKIPEMRKRSPSGKSWAKVLTAVDYDGPKKNGYAFEGGWVDWRKLATKAKTGDVVLVGMSSLDRMYLGRVAPDVGFVDGEKAIQIGGFDVSLSTDYGDYDAIMAKCRELGVPQR
jgi:hypothetical protein